MILDNDHSIIDSVNSSVNLKIVSEIRKHLPKIWNDFEDVRTTGEYSHDRFQIRINEPYQRKISHFCVYLKVPQEISYDSTKSQVENQEDWLYIIYNKIRKELDRVFHGKFECIWTIHYIDDLVTKFNNTAKIIRNSTYGNPSSYIAVSSEAAKELEKFDIK